MAGVAFMLPLDAANNSVLLELERVQRELDEFTYIASHDLREPLRGIVHGARVLTEDYGSRLDEAGRARISRLAELAQRLDGLIDCLLQYSRIGRMDCETEMVALNDIIADAVASLPRSELGDAVIRVVAPLPAAAGNPQRLTQLFGHLISNALKFTDRPRATVTIGEHLSTQGSPDVAGGAAGFATLFVQDDGIGIAPKHIDTVFRIFKRLHTREKYGGGFGIGLTLSKKIVEQYGGAIWLSSNPGQGTTVFFTLPRQVNGGLSR